MVVLKGIESTCEIQFWLVLFLAKLPWLWSWVLAWVLGSIAVSLELDRWSQMVWLSILLIACTCMKFIFIRVSLEFNIILFHLLKILGLSGLLWLSIWINRIIHLYRISSWSPLICDLGLLMILTSSKTSIVDFTLILCRFMPTAIFLIWLWMLLSCSIRPRVLWPCRIIIVI